MVPPPEDRLLAPDLRLLLVDRVVLRAAAARRTLVLLATRCSALAVSVSKPEPPFVESPIICDFSRAIDASTPSASSVPSVAPLITPWSWASLYDSRLPSKSSSDAIEAAACLSLRRCWRRESSSPAGSSSIGLAVIASPDFGSTSPAPTAAILEPGLVEPREPLPLAVAAFASASCAERKGTLFCATGPDGVVSLGL